MNVSKVAINFPHDITTKLKDYLLSKGFSRSPRSSRVWEADLAEDTIDVAKKINERFEKEKQVIIKFYDPAPKLLLNALKGIGFTFSWSEKQWYGMESMLTKTIQEDVLRIGGSVNII